MKHRDHHWRGENAADRLDRAKSALGYRKSISVMLPDHPQAFCEERLARDEEAKRLGIGGNGAPEWDPEQPVTGAPFLMRDIEAFALDCGTEITSRSDLRKLERERGVERVGIECTASSDVGRPDWFDEYKEHRREREKAKKRGKADPGTWKERKARESKAKKGK